MLLDYPPFDFIILSFKIRGRDCFPKVMRQMSDEQFVHQIYRPYNVVNNEEDNRMIVMPAYQQSVNS